MEEQEALKSMAKRLVEEMDFEQAKKTLVQMIDGAGLYEAILGDTSEPTKPKRKGAPRGPRRKKEIKEPGAYQPQNKNKEAENG